MGMCSSKQSISHSSKHDSRQISNDHYKDQVSLPYAQNHQINLDLIDHFEKASSINIIIKGDDQLEYQQNEELSESDILTYGNKLDQIISYNSQLRLSQQILESVKILEQAETLLKKKKNYQGDYTNMIDQNFKLKEIETVGIGANATVLKCFDEKTWQFYCLKIQRVPENLLLKVVEEIKTMFILQSSYPNKFAELTAFQIEKKEFIHLDTNEYICKIILELGQCDLRLFSTVFSSSQRCFTQEQLLYILKSAVKALIVLRKMRICHLDIKPHNIIIKQEKNQIQILDFGESKKLPNNDSDNIEIGISGTPFFMAPEIKKLKWDSHKGIYETAIIDGCKADIYSLGITILSLMFPRIKQSLILQEQLKNKNQLFIYQDLMMILQDMVQIDPQIRISYQEILQKISRLKLNLYSVKFFDEEIIDIINRRSQQNLDKERLIDIIIYYNTIYLYFKAEDMINFYLESQGQTIYSQEDYLILEYLASLEGQSKFERAIQISHNILKQTNKFSPLTKTYTGILAKLYYSNGLYHKAIEQYEKVIQFQENNVGKSHVDTVQLYNNIANVYTKLGIYAEADQYYFQALNLQKINLESDQINRAVIYINYGILHSQQGQYNEAMNYYLQAMNTYEVKLGYYHVDTALIYNNIGNIHIKQEKFAEGLYYHFKALQIYEVKLGNNHIDTAKSYTNIGLVYFEQGQYEEALMFQFKAEKIYKIILGLSHVETAAPYNHIGNIYTKQKKYNEAIQYYQIAQKIYENQLGINHINKIDLYTKIGFVYSAQTQYDEAIKYYKQAINIIEDQYKIDKSSVAVSYQNVGDTSTKCNKFSQEISLLATSIPDQSQGLDQYDSASLYIIIGNIYTKLDKNDEAIKYYLKAVEKYENKLGINYINTPKLYTNIGIAYSVLGKLEEAINYLKKAQEIYKINSGYYHADTGEAYFLLALTYQFSGYNNYFEQYCQESLKIYKELGLQEKVNQIISTTQTIYLHIDSTD